ncbi:MAG: hypothetical protein E5Y10_25005 [Mesorhizobium sp.]|uniref:hypothetical protein n=1 Tax=Mesorhizobium sp. TaxID=1871066 RepID=UPI0011F787A9|nr:hypothetical protein [Mesorhizobium sp.]TIN38843.1 MAG: hypothetical protein E5Y13_15425 [Mesorhizobium sp.]TJU85682.1 MAG: hypothetical protein E5Y10_25005 [Mesorhizobium sp.]
MKYARIIDGVVVRFRTICPISKVAQSGDGQRFPTMSSPAFHDGENFTGPEPTPPPRQTIRKSVVQARIIDAGKMASAYAALTQNPVYFARWFAPDRPEVYCDDPDAVLLVTALGLDPDAILAPFV